ncbi:MFS transporter [Paenarthrobacter sp. NPDC089989]|uniref:MFS transporter n=1 Tax=unclassified Paenarthrobacter TaxID=2634190 RepID=UPI003819FADD
MTSSVNPDQTRVETRRTSSDGFPLSGLLALSAAIFISMTTEFLPGGLIPLIAAEFDRAPAEVGNLITVFALTVILTAAPLALLTRRVPRKMMVLIAFALVGAGNIVTIVATTFEMLLAARVLGALAHGAFWSVVAAYPAYLLRPAQLGKATAVTAAGGSVAGVLGIPIGNALGQAFGWRVAFGVLAVLVVIVWLLIAWKLPVITAPEAHSPSSPPARATKDSTLPAVLIICLLIILVVAAQNSFGTFNVVWLLDVVHMPAAAVPVILLIGGAASAVGVAVTGALYSMFPIRLFMGALIALIALLAVMPTAAGSQPAVWILSAVMGAVFGGVPVMLQTRMLWAASPSIRGTAAALQTTAFNVGIGGGAFLGGVLINQTGLGALPYWAAAVMVLALTAAVSWEAHVNRQLNKNGTES